jgi:DNA-directed RNA polymerase specialized sigma24 family protein
VRTGAFEELFERHFDAGHGYLARRVGPDLGSDLASEAFTRAFAGRKRYDALRGEERPWLFGIANNLGQYPRATACVQPVPFSKARS